MYGRSPKNIVGVGSFSRKLSIYETLVMLLNLSNKKVNGIEIEIKDDLFSYKLVKFMTYDKS